ncbi:hypothetical protein GJ496_004540 [Pomphorhynchus laevis]|nr:hypothetical protein GJ496_004540 [Pomphorhynchus laevis]
MNEARYIQARKLASLDTIKNQKNIDAIKRIISFVKNGRIATASRYLVGPPGGILSIDSMLKERSVRNILHKLHPSAAPADPAYVFKNTLHGAKEHHDVLHKNTIIYSVREPAMQEIEGMEAPKMQDRIRQEIKADKQNMIQQVRDDLKSASDELLTIIENANIQLIAERVKNNHSLECQEVNLNNNFLHQLHYLTEMLSEVQYLRLDYNLIENVYPIVVPSNNLHVLSLKGNRIKNFDILSNLFNYLSYLDLSNNILSTVKIQSVKHFELVRTESNRTS